MEVDPIKAISGELERAASEDNVEMFTVKSANRTLSDASQRPDPESLYKELWYEGDVCCLFSDSNLGKSIFAVQIAEEVAHTQNVLLVDCELSDKQFELRYHDPITGELHQFPPHLYRAEINPLSLNTKDYEDRIMKSIEAAMLKYHCSIGVIDNMSYFCTASEKGVDAGIFMMKLLALKMKYGWSLLVIAHTPKRSLSAPITQNDLAGSKKLFNFFDGVFAIGKSAKDNRIRYVKQLKTRHGEFRYDADNVIVFEIEKTDGFLHFAFQGFAHESDHLQETNEDAKAVQEENVRELLNKKKSYREIARELGISKSLVGNIANRIKSASTSQGETKPDKVDGVDTKLLADTKTLFN